MMNEDMVKGKWKEIKGEVQKTWGRLTGDELDQARGDMKVLAGLVQQKYGESKEQFEKKFSETLNRYENEKKTPTENVKDSLRN